jgi:hypothetical protein
MYGVPGQRSPTTAWWLYRPTSWHFTASDLQGDLASAMAGYKRLTGNISSDSDDDFELPPPSVVHRNAAARSRSPVPPPPKAISNGTAAGKVKDVVLAPVKKKHQKTPSVTVLRSPSVPLSQDALEARSPNAKSNPNRAPRPPSPDTMGCWEYPCAICGNHKALGEPCVCPWTCQCAACEWKRSQQKHGKAVWLLLLHTCVAIDHLDVCVCVCDRRTPQDSATEPASGENHENVFCSQALRATYRHGPRGCIDYD